jgi:hypothetical protein
MHSCFHTVLDALLVLYPRFTYLPNAGTPLATRILDDPKYYPYFNNCLGALDGTHISIHVPLKEQLRYRNRKGTLSQNVLAVCNFDMQFVFVLPGWEGSAHDGRVLSDAQNRHNFNTPKGKYWLGDAGYGNSEYVMAPYRGVRYHLKEQRQADLKLNNAKELFNLRHASLRNVIERIFGVVKRKFKILGLGTEYLVDTQIHLVLGLLGLYNFICLYKGVENEDQGVDYEILEDDEVIEPLVQGSVASVMDKRRDELARNMWEAYCIHIGRDV